MNSTRPHVCFTARMILPAISCYCRPRSRCSRTGSDASPGMGLADPNAQGRAGRRRAPSRETVKRRERRHDGVTAGRPSQQRTVRPTRLRAHGKDESGRRIHGYGYEPVRGRDRGQTASARPPLVTRASGKSAMCPRPFSHDRIYASRSTLRDCMLTLILPNDLDI